ncbi:hypothetical protein PV04_03935 [Phialophora macrospora]|uniref:Extracellular membrane protein CFEM domain-containing protein n=1 Tax=Phialophora macrospora TaxID=1851006 RepID=A0A0D2CS51_9EURO|nr:hypothetical protein PV04_03935 [Phialophora macrospora]
MAGQRTELVALTLVVLTITLAVMATTNLTGVDMKRDMSNPALVDPVTMPECLFSSCWDYDAPPPAICPLVDGPCPNNTQASDNGGSKCGMKQYTKECYCNLKTGLSCAWSCSWTVWWDTEDWFAKICPDSPALRLDFSGLPSCARNCLDDASFGYGCLTQSSNCFCSNGDLFGCQDKCSTQEEWRQIEQWLQDACDISPTLARSALQQGYFYISSEPSAEPVREFGPPSPAPRKALTWGEEFILAVISLTAVIGLGVWIYHCAAGRNRQQHCKVA